MDLVLIGELAAIVVLGTVALLLLIRWGTNKIERLWNNESKRGV